MCLIGAILSRIRLYFLSPTERYLKRLEILILLPLFVAYGSRQVLSIQSLPNYIHIIVSLSVCDLNHNNFYTRWYTQIKRRPYSCDRGSCTSPGFSKRISFLEFFLPVLSSPRAWRLFSALTSSNYAHLIISLGWRKIFQQDTFLMGDFIYLFLKSRKLFYSLVV